MKMNIALKSVQALDDFVIRAEFENHVVKDYDIKPLFSRISVFKRLQGNPTLFQAVCLFGKYGVVWDEDIDLACEEIWQNGKEVTS